MNSRGYMLFFTRRLLLAGIAMMLMMLLPQFLKAQEILPPRPEPLITPPAVQEFQTNITEVYSREEVTEDGVSREGNPFVVGIVTFRPHLDYRFLYGDGIERLPGESLSTAVHEIAPGLQLDVGRNLSVDYTPVLRYYSNNRFRDLLDHLVRLNTGVAYKDWTFTLTQGYSATSTPLIETGTQTEQEVHSTAIAANYAFAARMNLDLGLNQNIVISKQFNNYKEWSTLNYLNYLVNERLDCGLGFGGGYVDEDNGINMSYEQVRARLRWRATEKISFQVHGGVEDRQFLDTDISDMVEPIFGAMVQYQPLDGTRITLSGDRNVLVSYFQNQVTKNTEFRGDINQRLVKRLYLNLAGGYHTVRYDGTGFNIDRKDDYWSAEARLSYHFLRRGTVSAFCQHLENASSREIYSFTSNQIGFEVGYRF